MNGGILLIQWSTRQWKPWETWSLTFRTRFLEEFAGMWHAVEILLHSWAEYVRCCCRVRNIFVFSYRCEYNIISIIGSMSIKVWTGDPLLNSWLLAWGFTMIYEHLQISDRTLSELKTAILPYPKWTYRCTYIYIYIYMHTYVLILDHKKISFLFKENLMEETTPGLPSKYSMNQCLLVLGDVAELHSC